MLSEKEAVLQWQKLSLSPQAIEIVEHIRSSNPGRNVNSRVGNVTARYMSKKMGHSVQAESRTIELSAIYMMEHDDDVLEYWDQPPSFKINYASPNGKKVTTRYTADYFVIETNDIYWIEWKTEEELLRLSQKNSNRYIKDDIGKWRSPPCERYAAQFGLGFHVGSSNDINPILIRNLKFLEDYRDQYTNTYTEKILETIGSNQKITLSELIREVGTSASDNIYWMIYHNKIFVDLAEQLLCQPDLVEVYKNHDEYLAFKHTASLSQNINPPRPLFVTPQTGEKLIWDYTEYQIGPQTNHEITLVSSEGIPLQLDRNEFEMLVLKGKILPVLNEDRSQTNRRIYELLSQATQNELEEANRRWKVLQGILPAPKRTRLRYEAQYRFGETNFDSGYLGLIPKTHRRGNRTSKLDNKVLEIAMDVIENIYESNVQKTAYSTYGELKLRCDENGLCCPSYPTFLKMLKNRSRYDQTEARTGKKKASKFKEFSINTNSIPVHGERPWEYLHIDHTLLDIELVSSTGYVGLGRPWLTLALDSFSRRCLGHHLSFDRPSYIACMMTLRSCVKQYNRLPDYVVVDHGKEFDSTYFETLLARFSINKLGRPPGEPRFGSPVERIFGTTNSQFLYSLTGNTQNMKNVREVSKTHNPKKNAVWTLMKLNEKIEEYLYSIYDNNPHPTLNGNSPRSAYIYGLQVTGSRSQKIIPYDEKFLILTYPEIRSGKTKVHPGRGIKHNHIYYWCDAMRNPLVENTSIPARYDPNNISIVFAYINGRWQKCLSQNYQDIKGLTEKRLSMITTEIKKVNQDQTHRYINITSKTIAEFHRKLADVEDDLLTLRDQEAGELRKRSNLDQIATDSPELISSDQDQKHPEITSDMNDFQNLDIDIMGDL